TAELRVTNLEYEARAFGAWGLAQETRPVSRTDVRWLEYQEDTSGPESDHFGGLYAVLRWSSVCILRYADAEQTEQVIQRIATSFPDFANEWVKESDRGGGVGELGGHFISLGLDRREPGS